MITRNFNLNLYAGNSSPLVINTNQYDSGEQWVFTLYDENGVQYTPSTGAIVGIKSDGLGIINTGSVVDGKVVINETQQMTAAIGKATFELMLDSQTHGTANFVVLVEPKPGDNASLSESDLSLIQEALNATSPLPTGGTVGQVLTKTANGSAWSDAGTPTQEQVAEAVSDWADENITVTTGVVIDQSLSVQGAAADSAKVGQELSDLKSEISDFGGGKISESLKNILENMMTLFSAVSFFNDNVDVASIGTETNELIDSLNVIVPDLTGITAVFNQTGIIYSDATLNDLKQYLTVTGSYADGTTREITDYSLDGTIAVGTQTITVASGNFTDTFTVTISNADVWYELPAEVTLNASNYIMTGIRPFEEDVNFTIFAKYTNSGSNAMYGIGDVSASSSPMAGGGKSTGNTTIYINGTRFTGSSYTTKLALTHAAGSNVYKTYFSKTGTERSLDFTSYSDELRIGGYLKNRTDLAFNGTVSRFIVYRKCLTDAEIATVWDGGTV